MERNSEWKEKHMGKLTLPNDAAGWDRLAIAILKSELKMADMTYVDLERKLAGIGVDDHHKNISARIQNGRFTAAFFLQALVCAGVSELSLPRLPDDQA